MESSSPESKPDRAAREAEYQALWQVCDRASRKHEYIYADDRNKRALLEDACASIMQKRRKVGKAPCGIDVPSMVSLHLQREVTGRLLATARMGVASPSPNEMPYMGNGPAVNATQNAYPANPSPFNGNPNPFNGTQAPFSAIPQPQARVPPISAPNFNFSIPNNNAVHQELASQREDMDKVINTLRDYARRIAALENKLETVTQERDAMKTGTFDMSKSASVPPTMFHYPTEGIEGFEGLPGVAYPQPRLLTPRSQTQGRDEDDREGTYQPGM